MTDSDEESRFIEAHGFDQLASIYAMQRQQDTNLWALTGMFAATNGVLIVALLQVIGKTAGEYWLQMFLGVIGLILCLCWFLTAIRATTRAYSYKSIATLLQNRLDIPEDYRIWNKEIRKKPEPPPGHKSVSIYWILVLTFSVVWAISALNGSFNIDFLEESWKIDNLLAIPIGVFVAGVGIAQLNAYRIWRKFGKTTRTTTNTRVLAYQNEKEKRGLAPVSEKRP